jgi:glycosyltransferase involved in cell wall biosynthesis
MTRGVRWLSIVPGSGYGNASQAYLSGLRAAGVPVSWTPMGWPSDVWHMPYGPLLDPQLDGFTHGDVANIDIPHDAVVVDSIPVWSHQLASESDRRRLVAFTTSETDRLSEESVAVLNRYDRVLVPSHFNQVVFESSGVTAPIRVVPHIAPVVPAVSRDDRQPVDDRFVFYVIATWTTRKAILDAVEAFLMAFTAEDRVRLVVHTTPNDLIAQARPLSDGGGARTPGPVATWFTLAQALAGRSETPPIVLSTQHLPQHDVDALHLRGDCFISLSRGEGWGLGAFDAGAFGNPVVVTGWGGSLEFLPPAYPYCVDYDLVPTVNDPPDAWWGPRPDEHWAKARVTHAATLFRHIFEHRSEAYAWGGTLGTHIRNNFESSDVTSRLRDAIDS